MVEPDLAELVDDDRGAPECGIAQEAIEQRRLAGAQEPGQHGERNGFGRAQRTACAGIGHCLAGGSDFLAGVFGFALALVSAFAVASLGASFGASFGAAFFAAFFLASGARGASVVTGVAVDECASDGPPGVLAPAVALPSPDFLFLAAVLVAVLPLPLALASAGA